MERVDEPTAAPPATFSQTFSQRWIQLVSTSPGAGQTSDDLHLLMDDIWKHYDSDASGMLDGNELFNLCSDYIQAMPEVIALKVRMGPRLWSTSVGDVARVVSNRILSKCQGTNSRPLCSRDAFDANFAKCIAEDNAFSVIGNDEGEDDDDTEEGRREVRLVGPRQERAIMVADACRRASFAMRQTMTDPTAYDIRMAHHIAEVAPEKRSRQHRALIARIFARVLSKFELNRSGLQALASSVRLLALSKGELVVRQGDAALHFFVVFHGTLSVFATDPDLTERVITTLRPGDMFGELALLTNSKRLASVRCMTDCLVARVPGGTYRQVFRDAHNRDLDARLRCLRHCPILSRLPAPVLSDIALVASFVPFASNEVLIQQGAPAPNKVFVVAQGAVRVVIEMPPGLTSHLVDGNRRPLEPRSLSFQVDRARPRLSLLTRNLSGPVRAALDVPVRAVAGDHHRSDDDNAALAAMIRDARDGQAGGGAFVEVGRLGRGQMFGEETVQWPMDQHVSELAQVSVVGADGPGQLLVVSKRDLIRRLTPAVSKLIVESIRSGPTRRQVLFHIEERERWMTYRKGLATAAPLNCYFEGPDPDAGTPATLKPRYWQYRRLPFNQAVGRRADDEQASRDAFKSRVSALLDAMDVSTYQETPRGQPSLFRSLSAHELHERGAKFTMDGCERLLMGPIQQIDDAIAQHDASLREAGQHHPAGGRRAAPGLGSNSTANGALQRRRCGRPRHRTASTVLVRHAPDASAVPPGDAQLPRWRRHQRGASVVSPDAIPGTASTAPRRHRSSLGQSMRRTSTHDDRQDANRQRSSLGSLLRKVQHASTVLRRPVQRVTSIAAPAAAAAAAAAAAGGNGERLGPRADGGLSRRSSRAATASCGRLKSRLLSLN